jgi:nucleoside-diphosphate-sugar epimerase
VSRVLVTGGSGFIARALVRKLRERGDSVTAIVRDPGRAQPLSALGAEVVRGDVTGDADEAYVLAGPCQRLRDAIEIAARLGGRRVLPRLRLPTGLLRAMAPIAGRTGPVGGLPADLRETIAASAGVTYWASQPEGHQ